jgi:hypothetical protein
MNHQNQNVGSLKRIRVSLEAGSTPAAMDLTAEPLSLQFIFGIAAQGLTPFEYALADRVVGDRVLLKVDPLHISEFFGHLHGQLPNIGKGRDEFYLKVQVEAAAPAGPEEVVKAMAGLASCGDHCCGDHP